MIRAFFASRHWRLFAYGGGAALLIKPRKSDAWIEETDVDGFNHAVETAFLASPGRQASRITLRA
jgi:hypothetical protein